MHTFHSSVHGGARSSKYIPVAVSTPNTQTLVPKHLRPIKEPGFLEEEFTSGWEAKIQNKPGAFVVPGSAKGRAANKEFVVGRHCEGRSPPEGAPSAQR